ncbi:MAG: rRNA maturation RNase YbeY [Kiritimatiellaeota bacterium]|nr:rRNA maturation RNase YbeY [Kiritimatiellota bacterium]
MALRGTLVRLMACVPQRERESWESVTVLLVDDCESGRIHGATFGDPAPADVITLDYREPLTGRLHGELVVNVECARREGERRAGWGFERELALYLAHGLDHLTGANDDTPASRRRMRQRELRWLRHA